MMRKTILTLTPAALLLLAVSGATHAASNAQLTVTANVVAATCDVTLSTNNLDLGNYALSQLPDVGTHPTSKKNFTVGLSECDAPTALGTAKIAITGQTLGGHPTVFNTSGSNTGITFNVLGKDTYLKSGDEVEVATAGETPTEGDFNGKSVSLQAGLATTTTSKNAELGAVSAPVLLSFAYN